MPKPSFYELYHMPTPTIDEQRKAAEQRFAHQRETAARHTAPVPAADLDRTMAALERGLRFGQTGGAVIRHRRENH